MFINNRQPRTAEEHKDAEETRGTIEVGNLSLYKRVLKALRSADPNHGGSAATPDARLRAPESPSRMQVAA